MTRPVTTYDAWVGKELPAAAAAYRTRHGQEPAPSDYAHLAWQRLLERRALENWLEAIERDDVPWIVVPEEAAPPVTGIVLPVTPEPAWPPPPVVVTPGSLRVMRGNVWSFAFDEPRPSRRQWAFGYLSPEFDGRRARFRSAYHDAGCTHVPFAAYGQYPGVFSWWDFREDLDGLARHYDDLHASGLVPMLFVVTDDRQPHTWDALRRDADRLVPHALAYGVRFFVTGWETDQVGGYLFEQGQHTLDWIAHLAALLPSDAVLAHHPGSHRTDPQEMVYSGWFVPYWDRFDWCRHARAAGLTAMLANWHPNCPEDVLVFQMLDEEQKHGAGPGSLGMWAWAGLDGYLFEFCQLDAARHARIVARVQADPRCRGWC